MLRDPNDQLVSIDQFDILIPFIEEITFDPLPIIARGNRMTKLTDHRYRIKINLPSNLKLDLDQVHKYIKKGFKYTIYGDGRCKIHGELISPLVAMYLANKLEEYNQDFTPCQSNNNTFDEFVKKLKEP